MPVRLVVSIGAAALSLFLIEPAVRFLFGLFVGRGGAEAPEEDIRRDPRLALFAHPPLLDVLLIPGEDGLFLVPLLAVGVGPVSAVAAVLPFAALHHPLFKPRECISKALSFYVCCLLVLPHGLLTMIAGHILLDVVGFILVRGVKHAAEQQSADT